MPRKLPQAELERLRALVAALEPTEEQFTSTLATVQEVMPVFESIKQEVTCELAEARQLINPSGGYSVAVEAALHNLVDHFVAEAADGLSTPGSVAAGTALDVLRTLLHSLVLDTASRQR